MRRRGTGISGNAVPKGPIFARDLNEVDQNVRFAQPTCSAAKSSEVTGG
jgi:hypothetical protein